MELSDDVYRIELPGSGAYLILGNRNVLIDTGMPGHGNELLDELDRLLPDDRVLDEVLLTHHDVDHIGNLYEVQKRYSVKAYISREDMPYAKGEKHRPGIKRIIEKVVKPKTPSELLPLEEYRNPEIEVLPMPGHTPGHTIFQYRGFLFTGDLFHTDKGHLTPTKKMMNWDNAMLGATIGRLLAMDADMFCPAHGNPVSFSESVREELMEVKAYYDRR